MKWRHPEASPVHETSQAHMTADAGSSAVCVVNCIASQEPPSRIKATIVTLLSWVLAWRPGLAIRLGKLVLRVWPNFRRV